MTSKQAAVNSINSLESKMGFKRDSLLNCILLETTGSLSPSIQNGIGATGLIQFMPSTAVSLGTTVAKLALMSVDEQLVYVRKYFDKNSYTSKVKASGDPLDIYLAIFFPAAMGKPDDYILETKSISRSKIASQNPLFDINKDKVITKGEIRVKYFQTVNLFRKSIGRPLITQAEQSKIAFDEKLLLIPLGLFLLLKLL